MTESSTARKPAPPTDAAPRAPYEAPAIVALGDVNTDTLQTGIPR